VLSRAGTQGRERGVGVPIPVVFGVVRGEAVQEVPEQFRIQAAGIRCGQAGNGDHPVLLNLGNGTGRFW
jgi:hypothetical protein